MTQSDDGCAGESNLYKILDEIEVKNRERTENSQSLCIYLLRKFESE